VPGAPAIDIFCVDYLNHSYIGQTETAAMTGLVDGTDLSHTRIGSSARLMLNGSSYTAIHRYRMAALLTDEFALTAATTPPGLVSQKPENIQRATWNVTAGPGSSVPNAGTYAWLPWVTTRYNGSWVATSRWNRYRVFSDVTRTPGAPTVGGITTTPEPATIMLMGTGLLVLLAFAGSRGNA